MADDLPFKTIAALVRTATTFNNDYILKCCMARLKAVYPASIDKWDVAENVGSTHTLETPALHFQVIALCHEQGFATMLPSALYRICQRYTHVSTMIIAGKHSLDDKTIGPTNVRD